MLASSKLVYTRHFVEYLCYGRWSDSTKCITGVYMYYAHHLAEKLAVEIVRLSAVRASENRLMNWISENPHGKAILTYSEERYFLNNEIFI